MSVYAEVAKYLDENGIKQSFLVERTGIEQGKMSNILSGKRVLSADEFAIICRALNKSPNTFIKLNRR